MDSYPLILAIIGITTLLMTLMPSITKKIKISYSIIYVLFGVLLYSLTNILPLPDPLRKQTLTVHLTELVVIISLMGTGLKIDRPISFKGWSNPLKLVTITMLFSIGAVTFICMYYFKMDLASSLLLGSVLAPTDPVLAADVQVGPPNEKKKDEVRFALTAEAGLNDGIAFPFVWLAITISLMALNKGGSIGEWALEHLLYKIVVGIICGYVIGKAIGYLFFELSKKTNLQTAREGFAALSGTLLVYGITELVHGYGFIAVFVAALTIRHFKPDSKYHLTLHSFTDQAERILVAIVLILFGGSLARGILSPLNWQMIVFCVCFVLIIRPLTGWLSVGYSKLHFKEKLGIMFFGIKGIGSFYYLSFALNKTDFKYTAEIWAMVALVVAVSILIHGLTATFSMDHLEENFAKNVESEEQREDVE